jgi:hypothetical protein
VDVDALLDPEVRSALASMPRIGVLTRENLVQVRAWFSHYLVEGRKGLPPLPRERAGI